MMLVQPTLASKKETYTEANRVRKALTHSDAQSFGILRSLAMLALSLVENDFVQQSAIHAQVQETPASFKFNEVLGI